MGYCSYSQHFCFCIRPPVILAFMLKTYPTDCDKAIKFVRGTSELSLAQSICFCIFFCYDVLEKKRGDKACFASEQNDWRFNVVVTY